MTIKELYAHALGYYCGRVEGVYENPFWSSCDGESESYWFKRGYDMGVVDYCKKEEGNQHENE